MKSIIITSGQHLPALEDEIKRKDAELKDLARKNAKHFAKRNLPAAKDDSLSHYTGEFRRGYEKLAADISQRLQPAAHFPEAKVDHDNFKDKDAELVSEITRLENENHNAEYELGNFDPSSLYSRIRWAVIATLIIMFGEILFNTKAFEVTGENLLFALILSISVSFAVSVFSHSAPFLYKAARTPFQRRLVVISTLLIATGLFTALAIFRSQYLAHHEININPVYFVIINLFFFIVCTVLSFFVLPPWIEIRENALKLKVYKNILKRKKEIIERKKRRERLKDDHSQEMKGRVRTVHYANYSLDATRKMYYESVEIFKSTNLACRTDDKAPECFSEVLVEPDIQDVTFNIPSKLTSR